MPPAFYSGLSYIELNDLDRALFELNKAYSYHPNNIHIINNLGAIHQMKSDANQSIFYYKRAVNIAPYYKDGILNLSSAYFNNNQSIEAYHILRDHTDDFEETDPRFQTYKNTILKTIYLNLKESETIDPIENEEVFEREWINSVHQYAHTNRISIDSAFYTCRYLR